GAAYPAREGDLEYLYQSGIGGADGEHFYDGVRQGWLEGTGQTESGKGCVRCKPVRQARENIVWRGPTIQRVCRRDQGGSSRYQQLPPGPPDGWRIAAKEVLSGTGECGAVVLHRVNH